MRIYVLLAAVLILGCPWRSEAGTPSTVDTTPTTQKASPREQLEQLEESNTRKPQKLDIRLEQAKRELDELQAKSEQLKLRIQELEENRSRVAEIKSLLTKLSDEGWYEISNWLQGQMRDRRLVVKLETASLIFEQENIIPLEIELRVLMDRYGEGHPSFNAMQKKLELSKQRLEAMRDQERSLYQQNQ